MDYYGFLQSKLPEERKKELPARLFRKTDLLTLYTVRDLCEYEDFWLPMIDSFKNNKRLYDVLKIYKDNKEQFRIFPEETIDMFCTVIARYVNIDSSTGRKEAIMDGLRELSILKGSKPYLLELLHDLKRKYNRRKALIDTLDEFISEIDLGNEFEKYEKPQR